MSFKVKFTESDQTFNSRFGEVIQLDPPVILAKEITANGVYNASTDEASGYNPVTVNVDMSEAYSEGYEKGHADGFNESYELGYESGKSYGVLDERWRFWDAFTNNGTRTDYQYAFYGWKEGHFNPTRDIKPKLANRTFYTFGNCDLKTRFEECSCKLDFSNVTSASYCFGSSTITALPELDCRKLSKFEACFNNNHALKSIEKIILKNDGTQTFTDIAFNCNALEEIRFEGVIGTNISFQYCPLLSRGSIENIINCLSSTATEQTLTLSKTAVNNAFGINVDDETTWTEEWNTLRNSKSNWTFSFA